VKTTKAVGVQCKFLIVSGYACGPCSVMLLFNSARRETAMARILSGYCGAQACVRGTRENA
jgi:hypothetical protein